ncbi:SpoIIE family protein phosphatase [Olsenella sp. HMSC062G07]|uniref:SpoIIE family protein phosphatase n=1 Tax=Olsenella sp. HMSC062G07 TaxID=1739330 RepID=UPI000A740C26|nr:SpoIIE family protein phosphatase [Olsenella sp. HMSC062G07]
MAREIVRRIDGIGARGVNATLAGLLALTSDAVLAFDGTGRVLLANEHAQRLFVHGPQGLVGTDVRALFPPAVGVVPRRPFSPSSLPFSVDGSQQLLTCLTGDGAQTELAVRAREVGMTDDSARGPYLVVAHEADASKAADDERERLVGELSRANHRLAGTLDIVLGTLGTRDVTTLLEKVIEEITQIMEATGSLFFVAEGDGYHLRGRSSALRQARVSRYMPFGYMIEKLTTRAGRALRLRVLEPRRDALRRGRPAFREMVDEETREVFEVRAETLPPFVSFIAVPVWFGGHVIALIEVGWEHVHPTRREDAELLDAVAQYLSVQLVGAFSALRQRKGDHLDNVASRLRARLMEASGAKEAPVLSCLASACQELRATPCAVRVVAGADGNVTVALPGGDVSLAVDLGLTTPLVACAHGDVAESEVLGIATESDLARWLDAHGASDRGAVLDLGCLGGRRQVFLVLRDATAEPFDDLELRFLRVVAHDIRELTLGEEARRQDQRIAQALQTGMRNELQSVRGLSAQGIYSSATATAYVGGDFYDLVRLPHERACVIMGDVSGKGVEAASVSAAVRTALGAYSWQGLSPARMVRLLNDFLLGFSRLETFATLFVGIVDLRVSLLTYCSAGHPPALLVRGDTGEIESLDVQSGVVGAFHEMDYKNGRVRLSEGDLLLLYTDGTTEARSPDGAFFGEEGLRDAVMTQATRGYEGFLDRLLATLDAFTDRQLDDDVAMVLLRFDSLGGGLAP